MSVNIGDSQAMAPLTYRPPNIFSQYQGFNSAEHRTLGDAINLQTPDSLVGAIPADWDHCTLHVSGHVELTYGEILALGGDLFGDPDRPISSQPDKDSQQRQFRHSFEKLQKAKADELKELRAILDREMRWMDTCLRGGIWGDEAYERASFDGAYNDATGAHWYDPGAGRYVKLALTNVDHFGEDAVTAYTAGHHEAIDAALIARDNLLKRGASYKPAAWLEFQVALAMNAFADHFLSDLFSSGHLRTPRRALADFMHDASSKQAAAMAKHQHEEDSIYGLFVENARRERWQAFGDAQMLTVHGEPNRVRASQAVAVSAREVWDAFDTGVRIKRDEYKALTLAPVVAKIARGESRYDATPHNNYQAQFTPREHGNMNVRHPMNVIDARDTRPLPPIPTGILTPDESPFGHFLDELWDQLFDVPRERYGPPSTALPVPQPPRHDGYRECHFAVPPKPGRVRYALAYVGSHAYPDGGRCDYYSQAGYWSDWIATRTDAGPLLYFPPLPAARHDRAAPTGVIIIRQFEHYLPEIGIARYDLSRSKWADVIGNANPR